MISQVSGGGSEGVWGRAVWLGFQRLHAMTVCRVPGTAASAAGAVFRSWPSFPSWEVGVSGCSVKPFLAQAPGQAPRGCCRVGSTFSGYFPFPGVGALSFRRPVASANWGPRAPVLQNLDQGQLPEG